jgi:hypothetical protein
MVQPGALPVVRFICKQYFSVMMFLGAFSLFGAWRRNEGLPTVFLFVSELRVAISQADRSIDH